MSSTLTPHPDREMLLRLLDNDLPHGDRQAIDGHLGSCRPCQRELQELREALSDYQQFHELVLKNAIPPPPRPWQPLQVLAAERQVHQRRQNVQFVPRRWLAAAAAIVAAIALVRLVGRSPAVKAAELLRKAATAEKLAPVRTRSIRIQSRKYRWDRPARISKAAKTASPDANAIRQLLESAGYGWEDPLSAETYLRWHDALAQKQDRVGAGSRAYVIRTTPGGNAISEASLTLDAQLHAVACTLQFGAADALELSEIQDVEPALPEPRPALQPPPPPAAATVPAPPATPAEELRVIAALHRIGADLGDPVDVRREGPNVLVNVTGLTAGRQSEVQAALTGLPAVKLQFAQFSHREDKEESRRPATQVDTANPLLAELLAALPGVVMADVEEQLADGTESIIARAYALRGLARRFPPESPAQWTATDLAALNSILQDHARAVSAAAATLERLLKPILPAAGAASPPERRWQDIADAMPGAARRLDEALNARGTTADPAARKRALASALANIDQRVTKLLTSLLP